MKDNVRGARPRRSIFLGAQHTDVLRELDGLRLEVAELSASRKRLALAADAERRDIERALHDGVQQLLVGLAANLEIVAGSVVADPRSAATLLAAMRRDTRQALEEARKLAHRIYPPLLEAGGLGAALRAAATAEGVTTRIDVAVGTDCPPQIAGAVYFCFLEMLGRADAQTAVSVSARTEAGTLEFEILAGCDVNADLSARDLVAALGGRLAHGSEPGHRTRVTGSLPLT